MEIVKVIDIAVMRNLQPNGRAGVSFRRRATTQLQRQSALHLVPALPKLIPLTPPVVKRRTPYQRVVREHPRLLDGAYVGLTLGAAALACWRVL